MELTILEDAKKRPDLFVWAGATEPAALDSWLHAHAWMVPEDLRYLWLKTGGGDFFESETIFAPFSNLWADDSVEAVNKTQVGRGMPKQYLAFHRGFRFSVLELGTSQYLFVDENTYKVLEGFASLESWYVNGIRLEFEARYSLGFARPTK